MLSQGFGIIPQTFYCGPWRVKPFQKTHVSLLIFSVPSILVTLLTVSVQHSKTVNNSLFCGVFCVQINCTFI